MPQGINWCGFWDECLWEQAAARTMLRAMFKALLLTQLGNQSGSSGAVLSHYALGRSNRHLLENRYQRLNMSYSARLRKWSVKPRCLNRRENEHLSLPNR